MTIRLARVGDEEVVEEACRLFTSPGGAISPQTFLRRPGTCLLLAEEDQQVLGWAYGHELLHPDGELTMLLYSLDVVEGARGRGLGKALVEAFVEHARSCGCTEVWALTDDANRAAIATYASSGGTRDRQPAVMLHWHLKPGRHSG